MKELIDMETTIDKLREFISFLNKDIAPEEMEKIIEEIKKNTRS